MSNYLFGNWRLYIINSKHYLNKLWLYIINSNQWTSEQKNVITARRPDALTVSLNSLKLKRSCKLKIIKYKPKLNAFILPTWNASSACRTVLWRIKVRAVIILITRGVRIVKNNKTIKLFSTILRNLPMTVSIRSRVKNACLFRLEKPSEWIYNAEIIYPIHRLSVTLAWLPLFLSLNSLTVTCQK